MIKKLAAGAVVTASMLVAGHTAVVAAPSGGAQRCPVQHMIYANGTFDSSSTADPGRDQGFFSGLSSQVTDRIGASSTSDLSAGVADAVEPESPAPEGMAGLVGSESGSSGQSSSSGSVSLSGQAPAISRTYVDYPATAGGAFFPGTLPANVGDTTSYADSMQQGVASATEQITALASECPDTDFFLQGYSQGAEIIDNLARQIGAGQGPVSPDRISGVSLMSSPVRAAETPLHVLGRDQVGNGPVGQVTAGLNHYPTPKGGGLSYDKNGHADYGALSDRTISWCLNGDLVCGLPVESTLARNISAALQEIDLSDPTAALDRMAEGMSQAVAVSEVEEKDLATVDFGAGGLDLSQEQRAATSSGDEPFDRYIQQVGQSDSSSQSGSSSVASSRADSSMAAAQPGTVGSGSTSQAVPQPQEAPLGARMAGVLGDLGGMALGAGITTVKNTITPENLAQVAMAGVTGGPQAAGALSLVKLTESGREMLQPDNASQYVRPALESLQGNGFVDGEIAELAVTLANWQGLMEHAAYYERPMVADGRTAMEVTEDWAVAAAGTTAGQSVAEDDEIVSEGLRGMGEATESVDFDTEAVTSGLSEVLQTALPDEQRGI